MSEPIDDDLTCARCGDEIACCHMDGVPPEERLCDACEHEELLVLRETLATLTEVREERDRWQQKHDGLRELLDVTCKELQAKREERDEAREELEARAASNERDIHALGVVREQRDKLQEVESDRLFRIEALTVQLAGLGCAHRELLKERDQLRSIIEAAERARIGKYVGLEVDPAQAKLLEERNAACEELQKWRSGEIGLVRETDLLRLREELVQLQAKLAACQEAREGLNGALQVFTDTVENETLTIARLQAELDRERDIVDRLRELFAVRPAGGPAPPAIAITAYETALAKLARVEALVAAAEAQHAKVGGRGVAAVLLSDLRDALRSEP